ncbi:MAG: porin family protein [Henriciella sp.]|nr:porin family protein [Henriciella sp.]
MQKSKFLFALGATLLSTQLGHAEGDDEFKFYGDIGYTRIGDDIPDFGNSYYSREFGAISGHVGYELSEHWSVEGELMAGVENDKMVRFGSGLTSSNVINTKQDLDYLTGAYIKGTVPITGKLSAFGRLGLSHAELTISQQISSTDLETGETTEANAKWTNSDTGIGLGAGLKYDVTDKIYIRGDYTRYDLIDVELDSTSIGIGLRF